MDESRYQYRPFPSSSYIRLLHLHPDKDLLSPHIRCEIEHVNLATASTYEAISYVWGSSSKPSRILCDRQTYIPLTTSLYNALRDLRRPAEKRTLWADAICINQDDIEERNQQVSLMDRVYRGAQQVVTYIGEGTEERYLGILLGQSLCDYVARSYPRPADPRLQDPDRYTELGFPHCKDPSWGYLRALFRLPWSSRMWIVQESVLNENMIMVCGRLQMSWSMLGDMDVLASQNMIPQAAITEFGIPHSSYHAVERMSGGVRILGTLRKSAKLGFLRHESLQLLLQACHQLASTDPRDKIYSLLNIAKDAERLGITPDYRLPVAKVYTDVAVRILQSDRKLDLLSSVFAKKSIPLPSWVPDWTTSGYTFLNADKAIRQGVYCASGETTSNVVYDEPSNAITLEGALVDRISYASGKIELKELIRNPGWVTEQLQRVRGLRIYAARGEAVQALWRTLIANLAQSEGLQEPSEAPDDYGKYFDAFVKLQTVLAEVEKGAHVTIGQNEYDMSLTFERSITAAAGNRSLITTERGYIGLAPENAEIGDSACILLGGRVPYLLRTDAAGKTKLIGEAYIHGLMKGEAMIQGSFDVKPITLV